MRLPDECINLVRNQAFAPAQTLTFRDIFPLSGEGWRRMRLNFSAQLTAVTTPVPLGGFHFVRNITLRTSKGEEPCQTPGMGLYYLNFLMDGVEPHYTHWTATTQTEWVIDIPFVFPFLARKDDLAIDSGRYTMIELEIVFGAMGDFDGTPSTFVAGTALMDITLIRNKSCFKEDGKPISTPWIKHLPAWDTDVRLYADIESARDLELFGFIAVCNDDYSTTGGKPYHHTGAPIDNLDDISFRDNLNNWIRHAPREVFQQERAMLGNVAMEGMGLSGASPPIAQVTDTRLVGVYPWLFAKEGTYKQALPTGNRTMIRFETGAPITLAGVAAPDMQIDLLLIGHRELR